MAGLGSRFVAEGYTDIKPLIPIFGKPMIEHVVDSFTIDADWVFIVQKNHRDAYNLDSVLSNIKPGCKIIDTGGGLTEGAACSVLLAKEFITDAPLIVINSDNIIIWDQTQYASLMQHADGFMLCFKDTDPKWSFAKTDDRGVVTEVAEKLPISDNATAGLYAWKSGLSFIAAAEQMIKKNIRTNNEFYICPIYNENIKMGHSICISEVTKMHGVGTPADLRKYISSCAS